MENEKRPVRIAVVIPAYKVSAHILGVIRRIGPEVQHIIVVDDGCPQGSGKLVEGNVTDPRTGNCILEKAEWLSYKIRDRPTLFLS